MNLTRITVLSSVLRLKPRSHAMYRRNATQHNASRDNARLRSMPCGAARHGALSCVVVP